MRLEKQNKIREKILITEPERKFSNINQSSHAKQQQLDQAQLISITSSTKSKELPMIDDVFKGRSMTFEELTKLDYKQFNNGKAGADAFIPSSILDLNDDDESEDEILRKFRTKKKSVQKSGHFVPAQRKESNSIGSS